VKMTKVATVPKCRFCIAPLEFQSIKGDYVYGGRAEQHFWQCNQCRMIYLDPPMSEAEEDHFYKQEFEKYMDQRSGKDTDWSGPQKHFMANQREVKRRMPFLEPYLKEKKTILELGCSSGFMLSALKDKGMEVYGIDPSGGFIEYVKGKGIPVFTGDEEFKKAVSVPLDVIIHYYVFEHIRHPVEFIKKYTSWLKKGGLMIFEVPCATDPLVELYKIPAFVRFYWSVAHHWYFTQESLSRVLEKAGCAFELLPEQRYDISNHMVWMLEGKPGGLGRYDHIFGEELNRKYKEQLKKNWLCDTIVAILKK